MGAQELARPAYPRMPSEEPGEAAPAGPAPAPAVSAPAGPAPAPAVSAPAGPAPAPAVSAPAGFAPALAAPALVDMHVHLGFMANRRAVAAEGAARGLGFLAASVSPADYRACRTELADASNVACALGAHPWWVADGRVGEEELARLEELAPTATAFGEVGLDFSDKHTAPESHTRQIAAFTCICRAAARSARGQGRRIPLSIHSVRAADACLDILGETGALMACAPTFHWFSGSGPEMARAVKAGCWFSVNERGLRTGKGREYAKLVPRDRLLLETDLPPAEGAPFPVAEIEASLERALVLLAAARHEDAESLSEATARNARALLEWE